MDGIRELDCFRNSLVEMGYRSFDEACCRHGKPHLLLCFNSGTEKGYFIFLLPRRK
jgi:hypothetical protein